MSSVRTRGEVIDKESVDLPRSVQNCHIWSRQCLYKNSTENRSYVFYDFQPLTAEALRSLNLSSLSLSSTARVVRMLSTSVDFA